MEAVERWLLLLYLPLLAPLVVLTFFTWPWKVIGHAFRGLAMSLRSTWYGYSRSRHNHRRRPFSLWRNMFLGCWMELAKQQEQKHGTSLSAPGYDLAPAYVDTVLEATKETQGRICSGLRASMVTHSIFAIFLFLVLVRPMRTHPDSSNGNNSVAVDLCGMFAGLAFLLSLGIVGVYMQLASLLTAAGTPSQFYWFICTWERAASGGQLATALIITFTFGSGLAAAFELFADWVFILLLFTATTLLYGYLYFWADSMWCPCNGTYVHYSQAFHRDLLDKEALLAHPSCCAFWELEPVMSGDARGSLYDRMDRYLWRESQVSWYIGSAGGALGHDNAPWRGSRHLQATSTSRPHVPAAAASSSGTRECSVRGITRCSQECHSVRFISVQWLAKPDALYQRHQQAAGPCQAWQQQLRPGSSGRGPRAAAGSQPASITGCAVTCSCKEQVGCLESRCGCTHPSGLVDLAPAVEQGGGLFWEASREQQQQQH